MQELIVFVLVVAAVVFLGCRTLPPGMWRALARGGARLARAAGRPGLAARLERHEPVGSGCGACAACTPAGGEQRDEQRGEQALRFQNKPRSGGGCH